MNRSSLLLSFGIACSLTLVAGPRFACLHAQGREEFNGPFPSWANVKDRFGAKGDGRTDDSKALQRAIDSLSCPPTGFNMGKQGYMVLYLPAGTYCISTTLLLKGKIGVGIIGEDPARTIVKWTGGDKDTLFWADGSAYFRVARISWDAGGRKDMEGIGVHWKHAWNDGRSRSFAALNIELSDNVFYGGFRFGISGGTLGQPEGTGNNDSEVTIRRCTFRDCADAGIEIHGYNALDYWIWDCRFLACGSGVHCSYGNYHVYRSFFSGSKKCDLHNMHGYYNSVRGCYSENGRAFSLDEAVSSNPFKRIFQDNTVINPAKVPVEYYHTGKITLMGNRFTKTIDTTYAFTINTMSWASVNYEVLSLHNQYGYKDPIHISAAPARIYSSGDQNGVLVKPAAAAFLRSMEPTPVKVRRTVFEVPAGADGDTIQAILDRAALLKGQRPVVHFGMGKYNVGRTLSIPAGADLQLQGDGLLYASMILRREPSPRLQGPLLLVNGPSTIGIQDLQIGQEGVGGQMAGILFRNVDQPQARAQLDQVYSHADTSLYAGSLNYLYVEKDNSFFTQGNFVSGGPLLRQGRGTARICCYGGQFAGLCVQARGRFLAKDCWWEGPTRVPLGLEGSGTVCIDGAMVAPDNSDSLPTIRIGKFDGQVALMNMYVQGGISVRPDNPALDLLAWNLHFYHRMDVLGFLGPSPSYRAAFLGLNAQCFRANDPACKSIISIEDKLIGVTGANAYMDAMTAFDRDSAPILAGPLPAGVSNIRISRVSLGTMKRGIVFTGD
ncbi:MAG: glycosyl hydrolase family 28-related protein [Bacteroidota bacterium]|nr:glycosyl hydrolase family 28-related protein [Bacteroidota bacterium]